VRSGISLDTVLRRYFAGFTLFGDFIMREAEERNLPDDVVRQLLQTQAAHLDQLIASVSQTYSEEREHWFRSSEHRRVEHVKRLLAGETGDAGELAYDLDVWHLAIVATGPQPSDAIRGLAEGMDRRLLVVEPEERTAWGWLGGRRSLVEEEIELCVAHPRPAETTIAIGEPGRAAEGWRLTHHQAGAALRVAQRRRERIARYADVATLATMLQDHVLLDSLQSLYLARIDTGRGDGAVARETLRAYFAADCNISSAAAALGVNRHTVSSRLRAIEERLGRSLRSCRLEVDAALRLESLERPVLPRSARASK